MKVLINTPPLNMVGGVAAFQRMLRDHMKSNVYYFTVGSRSVRESSWRRLGRFTGDYARFYRVLRKKKPDLVYLNPSLRSKALLRDGLFLLIAKGLRKKVLVFNHGWDLRFEQVIRKRYLWLFRAVFFRSDAFVVLGKMFRDRLVELGYGGPVYVETTAVDDSLLAEHDDVMQARADQEEPFNMLFLTRIERAKGIYEALDAYDMVKRDHPRATLTVAGEGSELDGARQYVQDREMPDITFTGCLHGDAKRRAFLSSDCYVFPSHAEGMPVSVLEAMACGVPVVTRAVGGLNDFFENGRMGFMTESHSPEVLAEYIVQLARDAELRRRIGRFNRTYAEEHFSASKVAARLERICCSIVNGQDV